MAVANDCKFILAPALQQLFRDKDTGEPLSAGTVEFFVDTARTTQKPVFKNAGTPSSPVYEELPNPVILNMVGAFDDAIYYNPYDDNGIVELYFIEVKNSSGVLQFTRESYPDVCTDDENEETIPAINYLENPQFRFRIDVPPMLSLDAGEIFEPVTPVGYAGWNFSVPTNFTSKNIVLFKTFTAIPASPESHPPAIINIKCESPVPSEGFKDLRKEFFDVGFLAGEVVTFQFESLTNAVDINAEIFIINNYGPGGSPTTETSVGIITIDEPEFKKQAITFTMPFDSGATVSSNVFESSVFIAVRFPSSVLFDVELTNFLLVKGAFNSLSFPDYNLSQDSSTTMVAPPPLTDGTDIGKILRLESVNRSATGGNYPALIWSEDNNQDNLIFGGRFGTNPWQRATSADRIFTISATDDKTYTADRFQFVTPAGDISRQFVGEIKRSTNAVSPTQSGVFSANSYQVEVTTTGQTLTLDEPYYIEYVIEGYDFQSIAQQSFLLSFWVYSSVSGVYSISLSNNAQDSVIVLEYIINDADTWEFKSIKVPPSITDGGWNYQNGRGLNINFNLTSVNTPATVIGSWVNPASSTDFVSPNQVNVLEDIGNSYFFDLIQVQKVQSPTPFVEPPFPALMDRLQRYFESSYLAHSYITFIGSGGTVTSNYEWPTNGGTANSVVWFNTLKLKSGEQGLPRNNLSNVVNDTTGVIGSVRTNGVQNNTVMNLSNKANNLRFDRPTNQSTDSYSFNWFASSEF